LFMWWEAFVSASHHLTGCRGETELVRRNRGRVSLSAGRWRKKGRGEKNLLTLNVGEKLILKSVKRQGKDLYGEMRKGRPQSSLFYLERRTGLTLLIGVEKICK